MGTDREGRGKVATNKIMTEHPDQLRGSDVGQFEALAVLRRSSVAVNLLPSAPDIGKLYAEKFLPSEC
jgi:hypothetical protein